MTMMVALALVEGSVIFLALCAACLAGVWSVASGPSGSAVAAGTALALSVIGLGALYFHDAYDPRVVPTLGRFALRLPRSLVTMAVPLVPLCVLAPSSRAPVTITVLAMLWLIPAVRAISYAAMRSQRFVRRVLILGTSPLALRLAEEMTARAFWCRIVGLVDGATGDGASPPPWPVLGPLERLDKIIEEVRPHRIIAALGERRRQLPVGPLLEARLRGITVEDGVVVYERLTGKLAIEWLTPSPLIFADGLRPAPVALAVARGLSLVASVVGLVAFGPLLGVIALLIRLDSPGPVFFVQERVGLGGKRFKLVKFRTMHPAGGPCSEWVRDNRDRITRIGRWLRKFRLDELPQFINILRGDMNLVGPRPHPVSNFALFVTVLRNCAEWCEQIPYYSLRLMIRPGLTGWAQVRYRYANDLEEEVEKTCYDLYYIKHLSLWLDLRILLDTVKTVLAGHGAADEEPASADRRRSAAAAAEAVAVWAGPPAGPLAWAPRRQLDRMRAGDPERAPAPDLPVS
jgi:exopolysaccharide biosynthesis polyprenyl glycosylphosphotransferase